MLQVVNKPVSRNLLPFCVQQKASWYFFFSFYKPFHFLPLHIGYFSVYLHVCMYICLYGWGQFWKQRQLQVCTRITGRAARSIYVCVCATKTAHGTSAFLRTYDNIKDNTIHMLHYLRKCGDNCECVCVCVCSPKVQTTGKVYSSRNVNT